MPKPIIDQTTPWGGPVARLVADVNVVGANGKRIAAAIPFALSDGGTLDAGVGASHFGGSASSHGDYNHALGNLLTNLEAFMVANKDFLAVLDQGNPL